MRNSTSGVVFKNTDQLWGAVVGKLSNEIRANVYVPEGRAHFFIKHHGEHIGAKDFRYTILYQTSTKTASVTVETPEGGEKAKAAIQKFIDSHSEGNILKGVAAKQGVKNKSKWSWAVTKEAEELNDELVQWYVDTINSFYQFFETPLADTTEVKVNTEESFEDFQDYHYDYNNNKELRITIGAQRMFQEIQVHPIIMKKSEQVLKDNNMDAEASFEAIVDLNYDFDHRTQLYYYFLPMYCHCNLSVGEVDDFRRTITDEGGHEIYDYKNDDYIIENAVRTLSFDDISDDKDSIEEQKKFFKETKFFEDDDSGFAPYFRKAFNDLRNNKTREETFIPTAMAESVRQFDERVINDGEYDVVSPTMAAKAILYGSTVDDYVDMTFFITMPKDEKFDINKLEFVNTDAGYSNCSDVLKKHIGDDMVCLNMIRYDGVMYFANPRNILYDSGRCYDRCFNDYDIVDGNMKSIK